jgi:hypothetical protein
MLDKKIKEIYGAIPHPILDKFPPVAGSNSYKLNHEGYGFALVNTLKLEKKSNKTEVEVELIDFVSDDLNKNYLFFTYREGQFRLIKEF